jgi:hypothetical protein
MKTLTILALCALLTVKSVQASEEDIFLTTLQTTTLRAKAWPQLGEVSATFSFSPISKTRPLSSVTLEYGGSKIIVPEKSYSSHPELIIESARISAESGYDKYPSVYLSFQTKADAKKRYFFGFTNCKFDRTFVHGYE